MRALVLGFLVFVSGCFSVAKLHPERPDDNTYFAIADRSFTVRGTKFFVLTDNTQTDVHLEVRYVIGADQDPKGKEGLAHVVEHLLFEVPIGDLDDSESYGKALSKMSLNWNAFTQLDTTSYLTTLPKSSLVSVLNLEMMRAQRGCRGLTEDAFLREREVVRNEARERDLGGPSIANAISEFIYPEGHPYRRSVIGTDQSLTSITMKDACDFMAAHYHANNCIIVVSGPVNPGDVQSLANALLGPALPEQEKAELAVSPVISHTRGATTIDLDIETALVVATWPMAAVGTQTYRRQHQVLKWNGRNPTKGRKQGRLGCRGRCDAIWRPQSSCDARLCCRYRCHRPDSSGVAYPESSREDASQEWQVHSLLPIAATPTFAVRGARKPNGALRRVPAIRRARLCAG